MVSLGAGQDRPGVFGWGSTKSKIEFSERRGQDPFAKDQIVLAGYGHVCLEESPSCPGGCLTAYASPLSTSICLEGAARRLLAVRNCAFYCAFFFDSPSGSPYFISDFVT